jgi:hypothetical protein
MRITIDVTKRDINTAAKGDYLTCPIRLAVRRALEVRESSVVGRNLHISDTHIFVESEETWDEINLATLPKVAQDFTSDFDAEKSVAPFTFVADFSKRQAKRAGLTLPTA